MNKKLGANGKKFTLARHCPSRTVDKFITFYYDLLEFEKVRMKDIPHILSLKKVSENKVINFLWIILAEQKHSF